MKWTSSIPSACFMVSASLHVCKKNEAITHSCQLPVRCVCVCVYVCEYVISDMLFH